MADLVYYNSFDQMANKNIDWEVDTVKVALIQNTYTPNVDDTLWASGLNPYDKEVANGNGYTSGGQTVTATVSTSMTNNNTKFDIADPIWTATGSGFTARYGVIYVTPSTGDKPLFYLIDFGGDKTVSAGATFKIVIDSDGLFTVA